MSDKLARPTPFDLDLMTDRLTFQQLDIDYYTDKPMKGMPGAKTGTVATMRIFGVTRQQNSICCHVHNFAPYLYVTVPPQFTVSYLSCSYYFLEELVNSYCVIFLQEGMIKPFQEAVNKALVANSKAKQEIAKMVLEVDLPNKESMYGFHENKKSQFLALPRFIGAGKRLLESGESSHPFNSFSYQAKMNQT